MVMAIGREASSRANPDMFIGAGTRSLGDTGPPNLVRSSVPVGDMGQQTGDEATKLLLLSY